jgi:hypothetical protein
VRDSVIAVTVTRMTRVAADRAAMYVIVEGTADTVARVESKLKAISDALKRFGAG